MLNMKPESKVIGVCTEDSAIEIERELVALLDKMREERKISRMTWGKIVFADVISNTQGKIQDIVGKRGTRKPKRLSVGDFIKLCQGLGVEPTQILATVLLRHSQKHHSPNLIHFELD